MHKSLSSRLIALPLMLILICLGCPDIYRTSDGEFVEDGDRSLELVVTPDNLDIAGGGVATILVQVAFTNGSALANGTVILTSSLGTLGANELTTDEDGIATTTLTPSEVTGWCVIVATHKRLQAIAEVSFYETGDGGGE